MITLLNRYIYQAFDLANMKALMQTAEIKLIMVYAVFELSLNIVIVLLPPPPPPTQTYAAARKQIKFRNKLLVISL